MRDTIQTLLTGDLPRCAVCQIKSIGICAHSSEEELSWLEDAKLYRRYAAGSMITFAGDRLDYVGSIMTGIAAIGGSREDGRRQTYGVLMPGDFLGRPGRAVSSFDIEAITDIELCGFKPSAFDNLLEKAPQLHARMLEMTLDELDAARAWMMMLGRKTAREKLCSLLVYLLDRQRRLDESKKATALRLPLTRERIGDFLALTLETVSRQFSALKRDGLIKDLERHLVDIPDIERLRHEAGNDQ
jgi:CRP/FNR family transcriptional regulator, anaerobic regulatory protein